MDKELEEAKEWLKHEIKVYDNNKEINQLIGGKLGEKQHKINKTLLNYIENSIPTKKVEDKIEKLNDIKSEYSQRVIYSKTSTFTELAQEILKELLEDK